MHGLRAQVSLLAMATGLSSLGLVHGCGSSGGDDGARDEASAPEGATSLDGATAPEGATTPDGATTKDAGVDSGVIGVPIGTLSPTYVDFDINHVLITGQSNAVANGGNPPLTTTQPFTNIMFDTGVMPMAGCGDGSGCDLYETPSSFVPLVEGDQFFNYAVETPAAGIANEISHLAREELKFGNHAGYPLKHDVLVSNHGRSGNTYYCLRKSFCQYNLDRGHTSPFGQGMKEVQSAKTLAAAAGRSYVVRAVTAIHGESDHYAFVSPGGNPEFPMNGTDGTPNKIKDYADALVEWQQDYESSIRAITGQTQPVPLLISALSGWTTTTTSPILQAQLDAHVRAPGKVVYVTPAYPLTVRTDCLHFDPNGYRRLGEYFAKVYTRIVFNGQKWEPVRPKQITRAGNVITVKFHVPVPPLTFDTMAVQAADNFGFDVLDNGGIVSSTAAVTGPDTVTITVAAAPAGAVRLRYAENEPGPGLGCIGPGTQGFSPGSRGNLRDSDTAPSQYGYALYNWGANFDVPVP